ncbi:MAG TPA: Type 1 glutamine amidotransferase-like domain-containing protein [Gemmataceae bacterium]|nr:Type 1 glutamine amidotransferase-like domain-containing protein [Gemmataceae bacterium]
MKTVRIPAVCVLLLSIAFAARGGEAPEYGPAKGTLIIIGGGSLKDTGILETFLRLAGGKDARLVVVPTAGGNKRADGRIRVYDADKVVAPWKNRGFKHVRMLHTHDPKVADTEEFAAALTDATAVWFDGGRQWNLVDSYRNTRTHRAFQKVLERGGVIAGSSAGATIQGDYLVRGAVAGPDIVMTPEKEHERGLNFLRKTAIDQHINTRKRWDDLIPVIKKYPEMLGLGLSEGTAIVVKGDRFEVIGSWKVAVHDNQRAYQPWEKPYFVLSRGDVYNMKSRRIERFGNGRTATAYPAILSEGSNPGAPVGASSSKRNDLLTGVWVVVATSNGGKEDAQLKDNRATFADGKITFKSKDGKEHAATYTLGANKIPATIDLVPADGPHKGKTLKAIYMIEKKELMLCIGKDGEDRPPTFSSKAGEETFLLTLKKIDNGE